MIVAINRLRVPAEYAHHLERAFGGSGSMADVPGFVGFQLLRREEGDEYLVWTAWQSKHDFESWRASEAFHRAHLGSNPNSPVQSSLELYDVLMEQRGPEA